MIKSYRKDMCSNSLRAGVTVCALFQISFLSSCSSLQESPKYSFSEGIYKTKIEGTRAGKVYVDIFTDSLVLYPASLANGTVTLDTLHKTAIAIPAERKEGLTKPFLFSRYSFDLDVLTIPFKFRPPVAGIPPQLNTAFQGALYVGARGDVFRLNYKKSPAHNYRRSTNHFGYSFGLFSGLGSSVVNETVTNDQVEYEYDGVVFLNGVAGIVGVNNFTVGLAIGFDHLLDRNRAYWIYQKKPWLGLALGLNLN